MKSTEQIKQIAYCLIAISMVLIAGFAYVGVNHDEGRQTLFFDQMSPSETKASVVKNYVGTIDQTIKIHMHLQISGERVVGYYYYDIFEKVLILKGTIDEKGSYHLVEYDENENKTGVFSGKIEPDYNALSGNWTSVSGKKVLPVSLELMEDSNKIVDYLYE